MHTLLEILSVVGRIALESPEVAGGPCTPEPHVLSVSPDAPSNVTKTIHAKTETQAILKYLSFITPFPPVIVISKRYLIYDKIKKDIDLNEHDFKYIIKTDKYCLYILTSNSFVLDKGKIIYCEIRSGEYDFLDELVFEIKPEEVILNFTDDDLNKIIINDNYRNINISVFFIIILNCNFVLF